MVNACLLFACVASLALPAASNAATADRADQALALRLRADIQVAGRQWSLAEAIEATPDVVRRAGLDRLLLKAPQLGYLLQYRPAQLEQMIRARAARALPPMAWSGADRLQVVRQTQLIPAADLEQAALAAVGAPALVSVTEPMEDLEVPTGRYTLRPRLLGQPTGDRRLAWIDVVIDDRIVRSASVALRAGAAAPVALAARTLLAGETVRSEDFTTASSAAELAADMPARRLRHGLRAGEAVSDDAFMVAGAVRRGDTVALLVRGAMLTLEATGVAASDALPGQTVAVRRAQANDLVRGRLGADGKVVVE